MQVFGSEIESAYVESVYQASIAWPCKPGSSHYVGETENVDCG